MGESFNFPFIFLKRLIKISFNPMCSLVYSNLFTKLLKREGVYVSDMSEKIKMMLRYDMYCDKILGTINMVYHDSIWDFKYYKDRGVPCSVKPATPKPT